MTAPAPPSAGHHLLAAQHLRLFALLLDYLIVIGGLKLAEQVLLGEGWDLRLATEQASLFPLWWLAAITALFGVKDLLGASPGKWVTGISVRRRDAPAQRPARWRLAARNASLLLLPLDVYSLFRDAQFRRLGDRWFGTVVVVRHPELSAVTRAFGLGTLFLGFILAALLITSWNLRRTAAYQTARGAVLAHPGLAASLGEPVTLDSSPDMELRLDRGRAVLVFKAKGPARAADVRVHLVLNRTAPPRWSVAGVDMPNPSAGQLPPVTDAPPRPPGQ